jgi:general L-amino acid transport system substrate-binding protein
MKKSFATSLFAAAMVTVAGTAGAQTLEEVQNKGFIDCGANASGLPGFAVTNDEGEWTGFDVEMCRAIAAAVFGDPSAVKFTPLTAKERFTALQSGVIDVLVRNTTWTMTRDTQLGLNFTGVNYYDGQGFMIRKDLGVTSALELDGASVCVQTGTTTELNLADYFRANNMTVNPVVFETANEALSSYENGRCDAFTTDASGLYAERLKLADPDAHMVLPEIISKEPLGPVVRQGDDQWFNIVKWVGFALLNAEELGVTQANVEEMTNSDNPSIRRLLGVEGAFGEAIGLTNDWAKNAIAAVGNYGEMFDRNIGPDTPIGINRGLNALWTDGGIMYAPPIR